MPEGLGSFDLIFIVVAALLGFGVVKFMLSVSAQKREEEQRRSDAEAASARSPAATPGDDGREPGS